MASNIEAQLGELIGTLKAFGPALDKVQSQLSALSQDVASLKTGLHDTQGWFKGFATDIKKNCDDSRSERDALKGDLAHIPLCLVTQEDLKRLHSLEQDVVGLKASRDTVYTRVWHILEIIIAAGIGGMVALLLRGLV